MSMCGAFCTPSVIFHRGWLNSFAALTLTLGAFRWSAGRPNAGIDSCDQATRLADQVLHAAMKIALKKTEFRGTTRLQWTSPTLPSWRESAPRSSVPR